MSVTRMWKVPGSRGEEQRMSFTPSSFYDFSNEMEGVRKLTILNADVTGTHDYSLVIIERNTARECLKELRGQISDGAFENYKTGRSVEIHIQNYSLASERS